MPLSLNGVLLGGTSPSRKPIQPSDKQGLHVTDSRGPLYSLINPEMPKLTTGNDFLMVMWFPFWMIKIMLDNR